MSKESKIGWVYAEQGDYHRNLDPNWSYTPTYLRKREEVRHFMGGISKEELTLDIGCGEGVIAEEFAAQGYRIKGVDANYESDLVMHGDVLSLPFADGEAGAVLFLDVFEHIHYADQPKALAEIRRVLRPGGDLLMTIPNLTHFNSRVQVFLRGALDRTDSEINHVGERPLCENMALIRAAGFEVQSVKGMTFTPPYIYRQMICRHAARLRWLHDLMEPLAAAMPALAMINVVRCRKPVS
jgi:2-polyprenyl-3-methyl-5-hydroxy-6-metoxy-1,4-benzoquinol methylase